VIAPAAVTVRVRPLARSSIYAFVFVLTMLLARIALVAEPLAPYSDEESESAALLTVEFNCASLCARRLTAPPAVT